MWHCNVYGVVTLRQEITWNLKDGKGFHRRRSTDDKYACEKMPHIIRQQGNVN